MSQLTHSVFTSIFLEKGTPEMSRTTPSYFFLSACLDMPKTCLPRKLQCGANLRQGLGSSVVRFWQSAWAFRAPPRLVPDTGELEVTVKTHLLLVTRFACLGLMNVWKELHRAAKMGVNIPHPRQTTRVTFTFKKKLFGSLGQLPKLKSRCHH